MPPLNVIVTPSTVAGMVLPVAMRCVIKISMRLVPAGICTLGSTTVVLLEKSARDTGEPSTEIWAEAPRGASASNSNDNHAATRASPPPPLTGQRKRRNEENIDQPGSN